MLTNAVWAPFVLAWGITLVACDSTPRTDPRPHDAGPPDGMVSDAAPPDAATRWGTCGTSGSGQVGSDSYDGVEERYLVDESEGVDLCRIRYRLHAVGSPRQDCDLCEWAFDLEIQDATVLADGQGACQSYLGLNASTVSQLHGQRLAYGYAAEYMGHPSVMMRHDEGGGWTAIAIAGFDADQGIFNYDRKDGTCAY